MGMESARRLQKTLEQKAAKSAIKDPLTGEQAELGAYDRSAAEIWQNEAEHSFFADFLENKDKRRGKAIVDALTEKRPLTDSQDEFIETARKEFNLRRLETEKLRASFTSEYLQDIASTDKRIASILGKIGPEAARQLLMEQVEKMAFSSDTKFQGIVDGMKEARTIAESPRAKAIDARVSAALARIGITEEQYANAVESSMSLTAGVSGATRDELEKLARQNMGTLMTIVDVISGSRVSTNRARETIDVFQTQRDLLNSRNIHLKDVARALHATITPEMRVAMQKVMIEGGDLEKVPATNVDTITDMRAAKEELSDDARKKRFADALKAESKRLKKAPRSFLPAEKDSFLDTFTDAEDALQNTKKGRGIFASLLAIIFKSKADLRTHAESLWP